MGHHNSLAGRHNSLELAGRKRGERSVEWPAIRYCNHQHVTSRLLWYVGASITWGPHDEGGSILWEDEDLVTGNNEPTTRYNGLKRQLGQPGTDGLRGPTSQTALSPVNLHTCRGERISRRPYMHEEWSGKTVGKIGIRTKDPVQLYVRSQIALDANVVVARRWSSNTREHYTTYTLFACFAWWSRER